MNRRGKSTRAISPDIVSLSSVKRAPPKAKIIEKVDEGPVAESAGVDQCSPVIVPSEPEVKLETEAIEVAPKKKRGRPKKNVAPVQSTPVAVSPDINPVPVPPPVEAPQKKPRGRRPKRNLQEKLEEPVSETEPVEIPAAPDLPSLELDIKLEPQAEIDACTTLGEQAESPVASLSPSIGADSVCEDDNKVVKESVSQSNENFEPAKSTVDTTIGTSFFGATDIFERKYKPGFIPGLDLEPADDSAAKQEGNSLSFGSIMAKKMFAMDKQKEKESDINIESVTEDTDGKIRRSSRIKSLEESRGPRSRRREVVFSSMDSVSATSSRSQSIAGDEDSNSNSSYSLDMQGSPSREDYSNRFQSDVANTSSSLGLAVATSLSFSNILTAPSSNGSNKPLKVKSRWRNSLDAESLKFTESAADSSSASTNKEPLTDICNFTPAAPSARPVSPILGPTMVKMPGCIIYDSRDEELPEKLKKFEGIDESRFFTERKISKESKYMVCDCYLSKEDIQRGEIGCNEDCLNRLLMVECGSRCSTGDRCTNKKFQRKEYCKLEVFKTEKKGHGLRTLVPLPAGGFVIEYVGEVLSPKGFAQRTKEYAKEKQEHFYFMALRSDTIIDATLKGNCSRFINHSCEPNCETQKWTVNGELRIGFFAQRDLEAGEEITFDYQFQRYGKKAQKCFCLAEKCRGWIGGDEEEEEEDDGENKEPEAADEMELEEEIQERKVKAKPGRKKKKQNVSAVSEFGDRLNEELATLERSGLKNRNQTLTLCRLMVRAEDWEARERILTILTNGDQPCRRLFLDYHGLGLLHGWMSTLLLPSADSESPRLINDYYHMLFLKALRSLPIPNKTLLKDSQILSLVEKWSEVLTLKNVYVKTESVEAVEQATLSEAEAAPLQIKSEPCETNEAKSSESTVDSSVKEELIEELGNEPSQDDQNMEPDTASSGQVSQNEVVVESVKWDFAEAAKLCLEDWSDLKEVFRIPKKERLEQMKEHEREADKGVTNAPKESSYDSRNSKSGRKGDRRPPLADSPYSTFNATYHRTMRAYANQFPHLSKEERRTMFAEQVAKQEMEMQQRQMQDNMVTLHQNRCKRMNLDPATTPIVDPSGVYYLDPKTITWKEIDTEDPNIPPELLLLVHASMYPTIPEQVPLTMVPEEPAEVSFPPWPEGFPPPPPLPPPELPSGWEIAFDEEGRFYYYHLSTQEVQWGVPSPQSSGSSNSSCSGDSSDSDEATDIDEEIMDVTVSDDSSIQVVILENIEKARKSKLERRERRKLSGLVQERLISPRSEDDKPLLTQKVIRARKLELMAEKLHGIQKEEVEEEVMVEAPPEASKSVSELHEVEDRELPPRENSENMSDNSTLTSSPVKKRKISPSPSAPSNSQLEETGNPEIAESSRVEPESEVGKLENESQDNNSETHSPPVSLSSTLDTTSEVSSNSSALEPSLGKPSDKKRSHRKIKVSSKKSAEKVDHSGQIAKRLKEKKSSEEYFRNQIANVIVQNLNPYRKSDCKNGRITSTDHFKHLARKLTHMVTTKEVKHCKNAKTLVVNDSVKHKTKEFVKKYMGKFAGRDYMPSPQEN